MDSDKLNKWADLLLDAGKRNNLINFKDSKSGTVEIVSPDFDTLFAKVEHAASLEVFDPKLSDETNADLLETVDTEEQAENTHEKRVSKEDYITNYERCLNHMQYQIKAPKGFAEMLVSVIDKNEIPRFSFLKEN